jgi:hypothetical protein
MMNPTGEYPKFQTTAPTKGTVAAGQVAPNNIVVGQPVMNTRNLEQFNMTTVSVPEDITRLSFVVKFFAVLEGLTLMIFWWAGSIGAFFFLPFPVFGYIGANKFRTGMLHAFAGFLSFMVVLKIITIFKYKEILKGQGIAAAVLSAILECLIIAIIFKLCKRLNEWLNPQLPH